MSGRQRDAVRRGHPNRRCATHDHRADRGGDRRGRLAPHIDFLEREAALVEEDDRVVLEPKDPFRLEHARRP